MLYITFAQSLVVADGTIVGIKVSPVKAITLQLGLHTGTITPVTQVVGLQRDNRPPGAFAIRGMEAESEEESDAPPIPLRQTIDELCRPGTFAVGGECSPEEEEEDNEETVVNPEALLRTQSSLTPLLTAHLVDENLERQREAAVGELDVTRNELDAT